MPGPNLVLPSSAMPWGRWIEDTEADTARKIRVQSQDANSTGSQFRARADLMQQQIAGVHSVSDIQVRPIPVFSVTRSGAGGIKVYDSPVFAFNPPRPDRNYSVSVIASMRAQGTGVGAFPRSIVRINGQDTMFWNNGTPGGDIGWANISIMGTASSGMGSAVEVQFGLALSNPTTVTYTGSQLWCIFSGSIL